MRHGVRTALMAMGLVFMLSAAADYDAGQRAWEAGLPDEALAQWQAAADGGDRRAMLALGRLFVQGLGTPQDYIEAHKWFNLAASRGETEALRERDALAEKMTAEERAEAQKLAREWKPAGDGGSEASSPSTLPAAAAAETADAGPPPPRAIREAQSLLGALGYQPGPADGLWGARTARAYHAFLADAGLPETEALTPEALRALRTAARRQGTAETSAATSQPATDTSAPARTGPGALHRAAKAGDIDGLEAALAAGADVNARDDRGWTALMHVANKGYILMVPPLLGAPTVDLNVRAADGATALFMAVLQSHAEIVTALVDAGADIALKGPKSNTALDIAKLQEHSDIVALIEKTAKDDAAFERAKSADTVDAYEVFLQLYTKTRHGDEARRLQDEARRIEAEKQRTRDDAAFQRAKSEGTGAAYAKYLWHHRKGRHADEAAFARAEWVDTGEAYSAYLVLFPDGKHVNDARSKSTATAGPDLSPKCAELPGKYVDERHAECWQIIDRLPGCYFWNSHYHSNGEARAWSGQCAGGMANGRGTLSLSGGSNHKFEESTGLMQSGKRQGQWVEQYSNGDVRELPYQDGKPQGHSTLTTKDGGTWEGSWLDGKQHGLWAWRDPDGSVYEGPFVEGRRHGRWVERLADGRVGGGTYANGKREGNWVINYEDGKVARGSYVGGSKHGHWTEPLPWYTKAVGEGSYVEGKRQGHWVERYPVGSTGDEVHILEGTYVNDERHGRFVSRDNDGKCAYISQYENGVEEDSWDC